jgi:hypothetical protein
MTPCDDCEEAPATKQWDNREVHYWLPREKPMLDLCVECWNKRDNAEPPDPDGEAFRGGEAAAYQAGQCADWQRLK